MKTQYEFSEAEQPFLECETFRLRIWTPYSRAPRAGVKPWSRWRGLMGTEWGSCPTPTSKKGRHRAATALTATPSNAPKRPILSQLHRRAGGEWLKPARGQAGQQTPQGIVKKGLRSHSWHFRGAKTRSYDSAPTSMRPRGESALLRSGQKAQTLSLFYALEHGQLIKSHLLEVR